MSVLSDFLSRQKENDLYIIIDQETCFERGIAPEHLFDICSRGGVRFFQYRNKSKEIKKRYTQTYDFINQISKLILFEQCIIVMNDDYELAGQLRLPVHLGQSDLSDKFTPKYGYGVSTHNANELHFIKKFSQSQGTPDYIAFGAVYPSPTKPKVPLSLDKLKMFFENLFSEYAVLIGGITARNVHPLRQNLRGLSVHNKVFYAVISGIFENGNEEKNIHKTIDLYQNRESSKGL